jgi:hypothetical protein
MWFLFYSSFLCSVIILKRIFYQDHFHAYFGFSNYRFHSLVTIIASHERVLLLLQSSQSIMSTYETIVLFFYQFTLFKYNNYRTIMNQNEFGFIKRTIPVAKSHRTELFSFTNTTIFIHCIEILIGQYELFITVTHYYRLAILVRRNKLLFMQFEMFRCSYLLYARWLHERMQLIDCLCY